MTHMARPIDGDGAMIQRRRSPQTALLASALATFGRGARSDGDRAKATEREGATG